MGNNHLDITQEANGVADNGLGEVIRFAKFCEIFGPHSTSNSLYWLRRLTV